jgi:hypothetical protein
MILGSHRGGYEEFYLMGYDVLTFSELRGVIPR